MSNCIVLGDAAVHEILINLSKDEILEFLATIENSLRDYSVGDERAYQPDHAVVNRADGRRNLFRPFTSPTGVGVKIIVDPSQALKADELPSDEAERNRMMGLHGLLALCDQNGFPNGFINAEEVTGYRTSLSAIVLYMRRKNTANIVLFGAGKQALWHLRLALALRGEEIKRVTIANRSAERTKGLIAQIKRENDSRWKAKVEFDSVEPSDDGKLKQVLSEADVVFCTTPSKQVLFPGSYLGNRDRGFYVSAIGSWQAEMIEVDPDLVREVAKGGTEHGIVVADDREACLKSTGEIIQSGLGADDFTEVGEILHEMAKPGNGTQATTKQCLETGCVIYKSVGVSLTDLSAGQALLNVARKKKLGTEVTDF